MIQYNIYYGTRGGNLKVSYRYTKSFENEKDASEEASIGATNLYYKYEGTHHLPSYNQIVKESKITGRSIKELYTEHIKDCMLYYIVPTDVDTVSSKDLICV